MNLRFFIFIPGVRDVHNIGRVVRQLRRRDLELGGRLKGSSGTEEGNRFGRRGRREVSRRTESRIEDIQGDVTSISLLGAVILAVILLIILHSVMMQKFGRYR